MQTLNKQFYLSKYQCRPKFVNGLPIKRNKFRESMNQYYDLLCLINSERKLAKILYPGIYGVNKKIILMKLKILVLASMNNINIVVINEYKGNSKCVGFTDKEWLRAMLYIRFHKIFIVDRGGGVLV